MTEDSKPTFQNNMFLVNRKTNRIHAYFKNNVEFMERIGGPATVLNGNVYVDQSMTLHLNDIQTLNFDESYEVEDDRDLAVEELERPLEYLCSVHFDAVKGYRIIDFADSMQLDEDFSNDDLVEAQAFISILFELVVGAEGIAKWSDEFWDKYGLIKAIEKDFFIVGIDDALIYDSTALTNRPQMESPKSERWSQKVEAERLEAEQWAKNMIAKSEERKANQELTKLPPEV